MGTWSCVSGPKNHVTGTLHSFFSGGTAGGGRAVAVAGTRGLALPCLQERLMRRWAKPQPVTFKGQWGRTGHGPQSVASDILVVFSKAKCQQELNADQRLTGPQAEF